MAVVVTTLQFTASTGGGTQNVAHGHGATPEAALFFYSKATSLETARDAAHFGIGFSDGSVNKTMGGRSAHNVATTDPLVFASSTMCLSLFDDTGTTKDGQATATFDATNLNIVWSDTPTVAFYVEVVLFSGLAGAAIIESRLTGTTPDVVTHSLGLTTSNHALIFGLASERSGGSFAAENPDWSMSFGVAAWNGTAFTERSFGFLEDSSEADGRPAAQLDTDDFLCVPISSYSIQYTANLSNFLTNSFDATANVAAGTDDIAYMILGLPSGTEAWVGDIAAPTTRASQEYSPLSWTPQYVGMLTTQIETKDSFRQDANGDEAGAWGMSALDDSQGITATLAIENDSATTDTQSTAATKAVYMPADDGTLAASASAGNGCHATFTSLDSDGWTINTSSGSANSTQTYWIAWAVQGVAGDTLRTSAITGTGTVSATANKEISRAATISGIGTVAATGAREVPRSVTVTSAGQVTAVGSVDTGEFLRSSTVTATGTVAATGIREVPRAATIAATGSVTAIGGIPSIDRTAAITAVGTVAATGAREVPRAATSAGVGTVLATGLQEHVRSATITAVGTVVAVTPADVLADNSDPPITGGGRVMSPGQWPHHWEPWEEPQPREPPPQIAQATPSKLAELLAQAAAELGMPLAAPIRAKPRPTARPHPLPRQASRRVSTPAPRPKRVQAQSKAMEAVPTAVIEPPMSVAQTPAAEIEQLLKKLNRRTALLLLTKLLD